MVLRKQMEDTGTWLFRWRSYLPLVMIAIFLLAMREYHYPGNSMQLEMIWQILCLLVSFFGLGVRMLTVGHAPQGTSGRNTRKQVANTVNKTGLYSMMRNPLYFGNFFVGLGLAMCAYLWWLTLIYILMFWIYYERIIFSEEAYLREKFGSEYLDWAIKTPAISPNFSHYKKADLPFSLRHALKREDSGFFGVIVLFFMLDSIGDFYNGNDFALNPMWKILLGAGFTAWIILRLLKKKTTFLDVAGR